MEFTRFGLRKPEDGEPAEITDLRFNSDLTDKLVTGEGVLPWRIMSSTDDDLGANIADNTWYTMAALNTLTAVDGGSIGDEAIGYATGVLTVPADGVYLLNAMAKWEGDPNGYRYMRFVVNGASVASKYTPNSGTGQVTTELTRPVFLTAGSTVESQVRQTSGSSLLLMRDNDESYHFSCICLIRMSN